MLAAASALVVAPATAQKQGGTLTTGIKAGIPHYDMQATTSYGIHHRIAQHYSTLLTFDWKNYPELAGDVAESWTVAPDYLTFKRPAGCRGVQKRPSACQNTDAADGDRSSLSPSAHDEAGVRPQDLPVSAARDGDHAAEPGVGDGYHLHPDGARLSLGRISVTKATIRLSSSFRCFWSERVHTSYCLLISFWFS